MNLYVSFGGFQTTLGICIHSRWGYTIEIIDIECALLSFLSQKFVSTKWRRCKGILARPNLLWQGISRGCGE